MAFKGSFPLTPEDEVFDLCHRLIGADGSQNVLKDFLKAVSFLTLSDE